MPKNAKLIKLSKEQIEELKDFEPDALPILPHEEEILDEVPEEDLFDTPKEEKPTPGEGP
jgi:hypothetical protein